MAQWLTRDPIFQPWESPYSAMAGNPILFSDPQGLDNGVNLPHEAGFGDPSATNDGGLCEVVCEADRIYEPTIGISSNIPQHTFRGQTYLNLPPSQTPLGSVGDFYVHMARDEQGNLLYYGAGRFKDGFGFIDEFRMSSEGLHEFLTNLDNYEMSGNIMFNGALLAGWAEPDSPLPEKFQKSLEGDMWGWFKIEYEEQIKNPHTWNAVGLAFAGSLPRVTTGNIVRNSVVPRKVGELKGGPLENALQVRGDFPMETGPANGTLFRANNQGIVTSYATYDGVGMIIKRVDVTGRAHNGVETPHVLIYGRNVLPDGTIRVHNLRIDPRPAMRSEIP